MNGKEYVLTSLQFYAEMCITTNQDYQIRVKLSNKREMGIWVRNVKGNPVGILVEPQDKKKFDKRCNFSKQAI